MLLLPQLPRTARAAGACAALVAVAVGAGACSTTDHLDEFNSIEMGNPVAVSTPQTGTPAGSVTALPGTPSAVISVDDDTVAVQLDSPSRIVIVSRDGADSTVGPAVALPDGSGPAAPGRNETVLVPTPEGLIRVDAAGKATPLGEVGPVTAVAELADGRILTGQDNGDVAVRDSNGAEQSMMSGLTAINQLVAAGDVAVAISHPDTVVASVYPGEDTVGPQLRGGKASTLAAATIGWAAVSDSRGNALQIFSTNPVRLEQYFPVGDGPWAVAIDPTTNWVWVTLTGENRVAAYDISSGSGEEVQSYDTIAQPTSLALADDGSLIIGSGVDPQLQIITPT